MVYSARRCLNFQTRRVRFAGNRRQVHSALLRQNRTCFGVRTDVCPAEKMVAAGQLGGIALGELLQSAEHFQFDILKRIPVRADFRTAAIILNAPKGAVS